jgi:hypothetical protein
VYATAVIDRDSSARLIERMRGTAFHERGSVSGKLTPNGQSRCDPGGLFRALRIRGGPDPGADAFEDPLAHAFTIFLRPAIVELHRILTRGLH